MHDAQLAVVVRAWGEVAEHIRLAVLTLIQAGLEQERRDNGESDWSERGDDSQAACG